MSTLPKEFDEIRPYNPEELPAVFEELIADPLFRETVSFIYKDTPLELLAQKLRTCKTNQKVQETFFYPLLNDLIKNRTDGAAFDARYLDRAENYTFISNHRDIVIDSAFLSVLLIDNGFPQTVEIAIGDNLLAHPWIKKLVRINKSFIVQRSLTMRQKLESSIRMSKYIHFAIKEKHENVWIAQREGRAKDSNDVTQDAILKMLAMGGEGSITERLCHLNLVPLAISYEYDPCDFLKAKEFQQKRDNADFKKSSQDDLINMKTGIFGYKGRVHYKAANSLNTWLKSLSTEIPKNELFSIIAKHIDTEIHKNYRLYPINYIAADRISGSKDFSEFYNNADIKKFNEYLEERVSLIDLENADTKFLTEKLLLMYANPAFNHQKATRIEK